MEKGEGRYPGALNCRKREGMMSDREKRIARAGYHDFFYHQTISRYRQLKRLSILKYRT
jgi:hypothetical protein